MDHFKSVRNCSMVCIVLIYLFLCYSCKNNSIYNTTINELCGFEGLCLNCSEGGCDDMCQFYDNNCCANTSFKNTVLKKWQYSCVRVFPDMYDLNLDCRGSSKGVYGVYMVTKCSTFWADNIIKAKCENNSENDILARIPVYDTLFEKVTYKNMYCAFCNRISLRRLRFWKFDLMCDNARTCFIRLVYSPHRMCAINVIETCVKNNNLNSSVRNRCENGLTQNVYVWKYVNVFDVYKNEFCAQCNHETGTLQCWAFQAFTCWPQDLPPYRSVEAMVNLNLYGESNSDTRQVFNSTCGDEILYDPVGKTCLNVTCLPIQNTCISGKCHLVELAASEFVIQNDSFLYFDALGAIIQEGRYFFNGSNAHVCLNDNQFLEFKIMKTTAQTTLHTTDQTTLQTTEKLTEAINSSNCLISFNLYFLITMAVFFFLAFSR